MTRLRDVVASGLGLVLLSPLLLVVALAIRLDSPGPVLFRQTRVGLHGRHFRIHKFRTMRVDAAGPAVSATGDARVTRVGRLLRRTKIDELPQLLDVLRGEMSLVGPRPEVPHYVSLWPEDLRPVILSVRPGITDPVTVSLRNESELLVNAQDPEIFYVQELLPVKVLRYAEYVEERSFGGDLRVIWDTIGAIIIPRSGRVKRSETGAWE